MFKIKLLVSAYKYILKGFFKSHYKRSSDEFSWSANTWKLRTLEHKGTQVFPCFEA